MAISVTWAPHIYTEIGRSNLTSFIDSGFDNILVTPNGPTHRKLTKAAFVEMGDPFQPFIFGQYSAPFRAAIQYDVNLVFYGEDGEVEYGGAMEKADRSGLGYDDFVKHRFSSIYPESFKNYGISENDLKKYGLSDNELNQIKEKSTDKMPIYGECGGFMYLCSSILDINKNALFMEMSSSGMVESKPHGMK